MDLTPPCLFMYKTAVLLSAIILNSLYTLTKGSRSHFLLSEALVC